MPPIWEALTPQGASPPRASPGRLICCTHIPSLQLNLFHTAVADTVCPPPALPSGPGAASGGGSGGSKGGGGSGGGGGSTKGPAGRRRRQLLDPGSPLQDLCTHLGNGYNARVLQPLGERQVLVHFAPPRLLLPTTRGAGSVRGSAGSSLQAEQCLLEVGQAVGAATGAAQWGWAAGDERSSMDLSVRQHKALVELARSAVAAADVATATSSDGGAQGAVRFSNWSAVPSCSGGGSSMAAGPQGLSPGMLVLLLVTAALAACALAAAWLVRRRGAALRARSAASPSGRVALVDTVYSVLVQHGPPRPRVGTDPSGRRPRAGAAVAD